MRQARIVPFVPVQREVTNRQLDDEIIERERADVVKEIAETELDDLELDRVIRGQIEP